MILPAGDALAHRAAQDGGASSMPLRARTFQSASFPMPETLAILATNGGEFIFEVDIPPNAIR